jgi:hypothetical protein
MVRINVRKYLIAVTTCCLVLGVAPLSAAEQKGNFLSRWFGGKKEKAAQPKKAAAPKMDTSKIDESNIHEVLDNKLTASVERISQHVHDVVASLEKKIDRLQKQAELSKKEQGRAHAVAQKRLIDERINKEVTRQVSSLK